MSKSTTSAARSQTPPVKTVEEAAKRYHSGPAGRLSVVQQGKAEAADDKAAKVEGRDPKGGPALTFLSSLEPTTKGRPKAKGQGGPGVGKVNMTDAQLETELVKLIEAGKATNPHQVTKLWRGTDKGTNPKRLAQAWARIVAAGKGPKVEPKAPAKAPAKATTKAPAKATRKPARRTRNRPPLVQKGRQAS
ncbi:MAG: hypothetical protein LC798_07465 [Chloroflexi bacterium]|nr:hypothetical protein [Chloroflexota bacterium]